MEPCGLTEMPRQRDQETSQLPHTSSSLLHPQSAAFASVDITAGQDEVPRASMPAVQISSGPQGPQNILQTEACFFPEEETLLLIHSSTLSDQETQGTLLRRTY